MQKMDARADLWHKTAIGVMERSDVAGGMNHDRRRFLGTAAMTIAAAPLGMFSMVNANDGGSRELAAIGNAAA